jgi:hypothetical protein
MLTQATKNPAPKLVAKVLRGLLATERFTCYADLLDALKFRLAILRLRVTPDDITEGLRLVESNRPVLVNLPRPPGRGRSADVGKCWDPAHPATDAPIGRAEAAELYAALREQLKVPA